jgi:acyl carrier protein
VAPRTALEAQLVRIWEEVLRIAPVGVDDDFLDLGGDSLSASRLIVGVMRDLEARLSAGRLFECPNVAAMAAAIAAERSSFAAEPTIRRARREPERWSR